MAVTTVVGTTVGMEEVTAAVIAAGAATDEV
jgi:hypothetical protein